MIDAGLLARPWVPAWILLLGSASTFVGLAWDLQWHNDVGPDTFYTLPHLFIYAGAAVSGLVSLAVVLAATGAVRSGRTVDTAVGGRRLRGVVSVGGRVDHRNGQVVARVREGAG